MAVAEADWVVFGPGSWFTSVLPHLLVPDLAQALVTTAARRVVALNLAPQPGETAGFSPHTHLDVLSVHAPALRIDVVLADRMRGAVRDHGTGKGRRGARRPAGARGRGDGGRFTASRPAQARGGLR